MSTDKKPTFPQQVDNSSKLLNSMKLTDDLKICNKDEIIKPCLVNKKPNSEEDNLNAKGQSAYSHFDFEVEYSKDSDSSKLFDFSLEGERIVSSLCGPVTDPGSEQAANTVKVVDSDIVDSKFFEPFNRGVVNRKFLTNSLDICINFSNAITSTPEKECSNLNRELQSEEHPEEDKLGGSSTSNREVCSETQVTGNEIQSASLQQSGIIEDNRKIKPLMDSWIFSKKNMPIDIFDGEKRSTDNSVKSVAGSCNNNCDKIPVLQHPGNLDDPNKQSSNNSMTSHNKDNAKPNNFPVNFNTLIRPNVEDSGEDQSDCCDDEISFRKSAIKGCLVFEQLIRDLQLTTKERDLENYCRNVKRCVSVANTLENNELSFIISELILGFLKLTDSWGIMNSYFGDSGNCEYKPQNVDDTNLYRSFQDWQIKSKTVLDHLTVVIQNLKCSVPKSQESLNNSNKESESLTPHCIPQYNTFFTADQSKPDMLLTKTEPSFFPLTQQPVGKDENINYQIQPHFQHEIQLPKPIVNMFSNTNQNNNWKQTSITDVKKNSFDTYWDMQQSVFNLQPLQERKQRKKWTLTMPDFQSAPASVPGQGQNQIPMPSPSSNFQYIPQNKPTVENITVQPVNVFGNQYNPMVQNLNMRENTNQPFNCARQPTSVNYQSHYQNFKQPVKRKGNIGFKIDEKFSKELTNNANSNNVNSSAMYSRINLCNPQINLPFFQNNCNPQTYNLLQEPKNNVLFPQNFCLPDGKSMPPQMPPQSAPPPLPPPPPPPVVPPPPFNPTFYNSDMFQRNYVGSNQTAFCHKSSEIKSLVPVNNPDEDDSSEEYFPIKSYMKPGSYRVPNKCTSNLLHSGNNLNYIFDDILVTGITVPFAKTNMFSPTKKVTPKFVSTIEKSIQTNRPDEVKNTDLAWKAALASAEVLSRSLMCKQNQQDENQSLNRDDKFDKDGCDDKLVVSEETNQTTENQQHTDARNVDKKKNSERFIDNKTCDKNTEIHNTVTCGTIKTDDWLIKSFSKLDSQTEVDECHSLVKGSQDDIDKFDTKSIDTLSLLKATDSDESDNTAADTESDCFSIKAKDQDSKNDKQDNGKQMTAQSPAKTISIVPKPREYSRNKLWEKSRDLANYQMSPYKTDPRNLNKGSTNWIKYNKKGINRQTVFKLQEILNGLSSVEFNSSDSQTKPMQEGATGINENLYKIIDVNSVNIKLKSHFYDNIDQILADVQKMFLNSRKLNKDNSEALDLTDKLEILFDQLVEKHLGQAAETLENRAGLSSPHTHSQHTVLGNKNRRPQKMQRKLT